MCLIRRPGGIQTESNPLVQVIGPAASIAVFEKDARVGGRMEAIVVNGTVLEIGASILYTGKSCTAGLVKVVMVVMVGLHEAVA